jgi:hypothetical protein
VDRAHVLETLVRSAVKDGKVAGEQLGRQPDLGGTFVRRGSGELPDVAAELRDLAAVRGDNGRPDPDDRAAVAVAGLDGRAERQVALAVGLDGASRASPAAAWRRPAESTVSSRERPTNASASCGPAGCGMHATLPEPGPI